jgi:hypothetical protein
VLRGFQRSVEDAKLRLHPGRLNKIGRYYSDGHAQLEEAWIIDG